MRRIMVGIGAAAAAVCLSASPVSAYPPEDTGPSTTATGSGGQGPGSGALPVTGSDSNEMLRVGAIAGGIGVALVAVAGVRGTRRTA